MRYVVDTDVLIDASIGKPHVVRTLDQLSSQGIGVSIISYGEFFEGAFGFPEPAKVLAQYRQFLATFTLLPLTDAIMAIFAEIRSTLRQQGLLIPDLDLLIGATALRHDLVLLSGNQRHFERIRRLTLHRPAWPERSFCIFPLFKFAITANILAANLTALDNGMKRSATIS